MRAIWFVGVVIFALLPYELFDEVVRVAIAVLRAHDGRFESKAQTDCYPFLEGARESKGICSVVEFGEEAEGA